MKSLKTRIREALKNQVDVKYRIVRREIPVNNMNKKIFVEIIDQLRKIEDRRDFLEEEIGIDLTLYEDTFFKVIENLFKLAFNKEQLALIQLYLYQLIPDSEWDGTIKVLLNGKEESLLFKSPDDVWLVINKYNT